MKISQNSSSLTFNHKLSVKHQAIGGSCCCCCCLPMGALKADTDASKF